MIHLTTQDNTTLLFHAVFLVFCSCKCFKDLKTQREIKELYCPVSSDESQIKEVSIDLFEHFDFSPEKIKTLQGNDKTTLSNQLPRVQ